MIEQQSVKSFKNCLQKCLSIALNKMRFSESHYNNNSM